MNDDKKATFFFYVGVSSFFVEHDYLLLVD